RTNRIGVRGNARMAKPADRKFGRSRAWALVATVALLAVAPGCHTARNFKERTVAATGKFFGSNFDDPMADVKLQQAEELYNAKDYQKALTTFRALADNQGNSAVLAERARFMQAECRYQLGQFPEAADTYHKVLIDFPTGAYRRDCCTRMFE